MRRVKIKISDVYGEIPSLYFLQKYAPAFTTSIRKRIRRNCLYYGRQYKLGLAELIITVFLPFKDTQNLALRSSVSIFAHIDDKVIEFDEFLVFLGLVYSMDLMKLPERWMNWRDTCFLTYTPYPLYLYVSTMEHYLSI